MRYLQFALLAALCFGTTPAMGNPLPSSKEQKLLELETQVAALEQKAFELKQKIQTISDKVFKKKFNQGSPKISIYHTNKMAGYFHIVSVTYKLIKGKESKELLTKTATVQQQLPNQMKVYQGDLTPGTYTLQVDAKIRGHHSVLTYINNYKIDLSNRLPLRANLGRITNIGVEFLDNRNKEIEQRLRIVFRVTR